MICEFEGCDNLARTRRLCPTHYQQDTQGYQPQPAADTSPIQDCAVSHCKIQANARKDGALCDPHYQVRYRGVDPETKIIRHSGGGVRYETACSLEGCARRAQAKTLCPTHYTMARRGQIEVPEELGIEKHPPCMIDGCVKISYSKKLCRSHDEQLKSGKPLKEPRAWRKYTEAHPCLIEACDKPAIAKDLCSNHAGGKYRYGMTDEDYAAIMAINECENPECRNDVGLFIDHDHATGAVRGRLCRGCNTALGFVQDDQARLMGLIIYLGRHEARQAALTAAG